jgi:hypothetical protein
VKRLQSVGFQTAAPFSNQLVLAAEGAARPSRKEKVGLPREHHRGKSGRDCLINVHLTRKFNG